MAINPNPALPNRHALAAGCTGSGKSQVVKQKLLPKGYGHRVILWDPDEDYRVAPGCRLTERAAFARAVKSAVASGKGFRLAWSGAVTKETFEFFCKVCWAALDGRYLTYMVVEELADVEPSSGKAAGTWGELLRKSRKYGGILLPVTQRGAEVSKTCWNQMAVKWIGQQQGGDIARMAKEADVTESQIRELTPLAFWVKGNGAEPAKKVQLTYKKTA